MKKSIDSSPFLYEKYINSIIYDLNFLLDISKICYLFMDFEYHFSYNSKIKKIHIKILNNYNEQTTINFKYDNEIIDIKENIKVIDIEKFNDTFIISGNNSLIFFLPLTTDESYIIIKNEDNFELSNIEQFFFAPKKKGL